MNGPAFGDGGKPARRGACRPLVWAVLIVLVALVVVPGLIWSGSARTPDPSALSQGPSSSHWLGTDALGRDVLQRTLVGARLSILLSVAALLVATIAGVVLGGLAVTAPGRLGTVISSAIGVLVAFPALMLALFLAVILGNGATGSTLAIGLAMMPYFARVTENVSRTSLASDYVAAARCLRVPTTRIYLRHVIPSITAPVVTSASVLSGTALLSFASLSFLGLGVHDPSIDWGSMLSGGLDEIYVTPSTALAPGAAIVIAGLLLNVVGESLVAGTSPRGPHRRAERRAAGGAGGAASPAIDESLTARIAGLTVETSSHYGKSAPVLRFDLDVTPGERVGVIGESGSGKTLSVMALARLEPPACQASATAHSFQGRRLADLGKRDRQRLLATRLAVVSQDPKSALNPVMTIGSQLIEASVVHTDERAKPALRRAADALDSVGIVNARQRLRARPHQLSGGMGQRVAIAMGLMGTPALLIADEPTTALDATVQRQVLQVLRQATEDTGAALVLVSHDLGVIASLCERVIVMYAGRIVEQLPVSGLREARHPYTRALVRSVPDLRSPRDVPLATIAGRPPEPDERVDGCAFAPRCDRADSVCFSHTPALEPVGHSMTACWHPIGEEGASDSD